MKTSWPQPDAKTATPPTGVGERRDAIARARQRQLAQRRRRRVLGILTVLLVLALATAANWGPVQDYRKADARLAETEQQVERLEEEVDAASKRVELLQQDGYVETLAREEFTYVRPGEEVFIVTGLEESTELGDGRGPQARGHTPEEVGPGESEPAEVGPTEGLVRFLRNLF